MSSWVTNEKEVCTAFKKKNSGSVFLSVSLEISCAFDNEEYHSKRGLQNKNESLHFLLKKSANILSFGVAYQLEPRYRLANTRQIFTAFLYLQLKKNETEHMFLKKWKKKHSQENHSFYSTDKKWS